MSETTETPSAEMVTFGPVTLSALTAARVRVIAAAWDVPDTAVMAVMVDLGVVAYGMAQGARQAFQLAGEAKDAPDQTPALPPRPGLKLVN